MKIAILGAGPTALVAAWAAYMFEAKKCATIFAPGDKSGIWGAQYLHQPIPGVSYDDPKVIRYRIQGGPEDYLKKVYGDLWDGHISDDLRDQAHLAWDLRRAYDWLWDMFSSDMQPFMFGENRDANRDNINTMLANYDLVVNTVPRKAFCLLPRQHQFRKTEIWAMGDTNAQKVPAGTTEGIIEYNGTENVSWYRAARINGYSTVEWPHHINRPPIPGIVRAWKPISHNCDCMPEVRHLGRMGRWDREILVHHAFADMTEMLMIHKEGV